MGPGRASRTRSSRIEARAARRATWRQAVATPKPPARNMEPRPARGDARPTGTALGVSLLVLHWRLGLEVWCFRAGSGLSDPVAPSQAELKHEATGAGRGAIGNLKLEIWDRCFRLRGGQSKAVAPSPSSFQPNP